MSRRKAKTNWDTWCGYYKPYENLCGENIKANPGLLKAYDRIVAAERKRISRDSRGHPMKVLILR